MTLTGKKALEIIHQCVDEGLDVNQTMTRLELEELKAKVERQNKK